MPEPLGPSEPGLELPSASSMPSAPAPLSTHQLSEMFSAAATIAMGHLGTDADEAFKLIVTHAVRQRRPVSMLCNDIIDAGDLSVFEL